MCNGDHHIRAGIQYNTNMIISVTYVLSLKGKITSQNSVQDLGLWNLWDLWDSWDLFGIHGTFWDLWDIWGL